MAERKPKGALDPGFVAIERDLLESDAWRHISASAAHLYICLLRRFSGVNNGRIPLSIREVRETLGWGTKRTCDTFQELIDKRLIVMTRGSSFNTKTRIAREWAITAKPVGDAEPTRDYLRWAPPVTADRASKKGTRLSKRKPSVVKTKTVAGLTVVEMKTVGA